MGVVCMYVFMHICMYASMYVYLCMCMYYACVTQTYVCTVCMHVSYMHDACMYSMNFLNKITLFNFSNGLVRGSDPPRSATG